MGSTVLVSATTRKVGAGGGVLSVDLSLGQGGLETGALAHGVEELVDLALLHHFA
jgi:hypothetical protein